MVKISIIVPIYNTDKYLKKCIDSLLNQTESNIEILLLNDGSTDKSEEIIKSYDDKRIVYIKKDNTGIGSTRNIGIEKAKGEYLMFIDSDDYTAPSCVEEMYTKAKQDDCDIVISDYYEDRNGKMSEIKFPTFKNTSLKEYPDIIKNINLGPCNKIYRKDLFKDKNNRFEEKLKYEDAPFVCKMLISANKIGKIDKCLSYYVIHENSQTTHRDKKMFDILKISDIIIKDLSKYDYMDEPLTNLIVMILSDYTIQTRYLNDKKLRNKFIDKAFEKLNSLDSKWRKCNYLKKFPMIKRQIKANKFLTKLYCNLYSNFRKE